MMNIRLPIRKAFVSSPVKKYLSVALITCAVVNTLESC
jgi:hypothetical protein